MKRLIILAISAALITSACRKDIHLNLQNASGILVIEGNINDQPGPYSVFLSKSVTFYDSNNVVPVSGAAVIISDNIGNRDSLTEVSPGHYQTATITGTVGRTYQLHVSSEGKQYDATSILHPPVAIDSTGVQFISFFGQTQIRPFIEFTDPAGIENYYKAFLYVYPYTPNTVPRGKQKRVSPVNDRLSDGITIQTSVRANDDLHTNDTLQIELNAIDKAMYDYWATLNSTTLSSQTAAPANPPSNISNNALGYFSAYAAVLSHHVVLDPAGFHRID
ncbi:MAG: hypothetical protein JWO03_2339 [Bacteroidetes bacterium]|nr:hypothetical protein [Bacteroidota bacterium]